MAVSIYRHWIDAWAAMRCTFPELRIFCTADNMIVARMILYRTEYDTHAYLCLRRFG